MLDSIDFELAAGQSLQVLGGNGQGKSTLLRILIGLFSDFEGDIDWSLETPPLYLGHKIGVKNGLTVLENILWQRQLRADLEQRSTVESTLDALALSDYRHSFCARLSEGQRKRVGLARYFLLKHACWILDEPFSALDAGGIDQLLAAMNEHVNGGGSIIFTSHQAVRLSVDLQTLDLT